MSSLETIGLGLGRWAHNLKQWQLGKGYGSCLNDTGVDALITYGCKRLQSAS